MHINCSCGFSEEFNKKDDLRDYQKSGWSIIGINIKENRPYFECEKCQQKRKSKIYPSVFVERRGKDVDLEAESLYISA